MSLPRYPEYEFTSALGELPAHWLTKPLKRVATINDGALVETTAPDYLLEYVDIGSVSLSAGIEKTECLAFKDAPSRARRIVRDGDVLISTVRTYLKAIAPIEEPPDNLIASTGFAVVRPRHDHNSRFLKYALQCEKFVDEVIARSTGVSYPAINASDLGRIYVPSPPAIEQTAIATFLDRETAKIDALIAEQEKLITLLAEKRQATISHAVTKGLNPEAPMKDSGVEWLGEVPAHWLEKPLKALFRQQKRQGFQDKTVLSVYRDFGVVRKDSRSDNLNKTPEDLSIYQLVESGNLVVNKMKGWQGSLGVSEQEGITSPDYMVFTPLHAEIPTFLHLLLRSAPMVSTYRSISNGIRPAQWRLEPEQFLASKIYLPPLPEQQAIIDHCLQEIIKLDALIAATEEASSLLKERRSTLISAAVTGQIDVRHLAEAEAA